MIEKYNDSNVELFDRWTMEFNCLRLAFDERGYTDEKSQDVRVFIALYPSLCDASTTRKVHYMDWLVYPHPRQWIGAPILYISAEEYYDLHKDYFLELADWIHNGSDNILAKTPQNEENR